MLFGVAAPIAKVILGAGVSPWVLAGLLYTGSGVGLGLFRLVTRRRRVHVPARQRPRLLATIVLGGMVGPVLLMAGLLNTPAATASLLLTTEGALTAVVAWTIFREHVTVPLVVGMVFIVVGAVLLTGGGSLALSWPALAVVGACACWAVDNNLTRDLDDVDSTWLAAARGLIAGPTNLVLALVVVGHLPSPLASSAAALLGLFSYGISIVLFINALRYLGTARTGAYFGLAPFIGAATAVAFGEPVTWTLAVACAFMAVGVYLHVHERHSHEHTHPAEQHTHWHRHDDGHHTHDHPDGTVGAAGHSHPHDHEQLVHAHPHYPDVHHRHDHPGTPG